MSSVTTIYSHDMPEAAQPDPVQRRAGYYLLEGLRRDPPGQWTDNRLLQSSKFTGVIYTAVKAICDVLDGSTVTLLRRKRPRGAVAKSLATPGMQGQDDDYETFDDLDHPLARLIQEPNERETFPDLLGYMSLQRGLTGVAPLWAVPNAQGKPVQAWALPTALTQPMYDRSPRYPNGAWRVYPYYASGVLGFGPLAGATSGVLLPGEEVRRYREPHPLYPWDGYSPLTAASVQLDILEAIDQSRWAAMDQGVQMDMVAVIPGLEAGEVQRVQDRIERRHAGSRNARRLAVFSPPAGTQDKFDFRSMSQSPREMDYGSSWDQMVKFCLAVFGVPAGVAGLEDAGSYSKLYADLRQFHLRQRSYAARLGRFLTRELARPWEEFPGEFVVQVDLPTLDDPDLQEKQLSLDLQHGAVTVNELRRLRNREPVKNGDLPPAVWAKLVEDEVLPKEPPPQPPGGMPGVPAGATPPPAGLPEEAPGAESDPLAEGTGVPAVGKAMSALTESAGGAMVPPPAGAKRRKGLRRAVIRLARRAVLKAAAREGLVQKDVQYTRSGKTYTRKQWVRADPAAPAAEKERPAAKPKAAAELSADAKSVADDYAESWGDKKSSAFNAALKAAAGLPPDQAAAVLAAADQKPGPEPVKELVTLMASRYGSVIRGDLTGRPDGRDPRVDEPVLTPADVLGAAPKEKPAPAPRPAKPNPAAKENSAEAGADPHAALADVINRATAGVVGAPRLRQLLPGVSDAVLGAGLARLADAGKVILHGDVGKGRAAEMGAVDVEGTPVGSFSRTGDLTPADLRDAFGGVAPPAPAPKPERPAKPDPAAVHREVLGHLSDPAGLTPERVRDVTERLKTLTVAQIQAIQKERGSKGGATKQARIDRLIAHARAKAAAAQPAPQPAPAPAEPVTPAPAPAPDTPHGKARAALDAAGVAHAHLSDDQLTALSAALSGAFGATPAAPAAKPKGKKK